MNKHTIQLTTAIIQEQNATLSLYIYSYKLSYRLIFQEENYTMLQSSSRVDAFGLHEQLNQEHKEESINLVSC
jgi:hypothetical protein